MAVVRSRKTKILGLYVFSMALLLVYWALDQSDSMNHFLDKVYSKHVHIGFSIYAVHGLLKVALLVGGISIPLLVSGFLLMEKRKGLGK
ncbi:MAG: hypothetical protein EP332_09955 [Bacteroidetes bacterium]|nr:MAG: hypothetical protein EP332_09955 [Bacteroidota bacterium]